MLAAIANEDVLAYILADLALILVAARIVGRLAAAFGQPRVVGEILAGILIGPTVLGGHVGVGSVAGAGLVDRLFPAESYAFLYQLGQIGLVFYMFLVGIELDLRLLRGRQLQISAVAGATGLVPIALGFALAPVFENGTWRPPGISSTTFSLFLGAALSVTAFPVLARILQEKGLMHTTIGAVALGSGGVATVLMFLTIAAATASAKGGTPAREVGARLGYSAALILFLLLVVRPAFRWARAHFDYHGHLGAIETALLAVALAAGLAADRIGINALVGGFLAGALVTASRQLATEVLARLQEIVFLLFLPVFFAVSGLRTDFRVLHASLLPALLLFLVAMIVGKWGVGYVSGRLAGLSSAHANTLGVLMNTRGLLILVVGLIGLQLGVITPALQVVFVIGALVTLAMAGPLVDHFLGRGADETAAPPEQFRGQPHVSS